MPQYRFVASFPAGTVEDLAQTGTRRVRSELTLTPSTFPLLAGTAGTRTTYELRAVGITANGDALVSRPASVTIRRMP